MRTHVLSCHAICATGALTFGFQLLVNTFQLRYPNFDRRGGKGGLGCCIVNACLRGTVRTIGSIATIRNGFSHFYRRMEGLWTLLGETVKVK